MTTHTPGPWHVSNGVQIRSAKHQIAKVWSMRGGEGNANARLIAAAPDLLEACHVALAEVSAPTGQPSWASELRLRAAIKLATEGRP